MATLAPQISSTGISGPDYADILAQLQNAYWSIYGSDAVLTADSQDGQFLAVVAQAIYDCGQVAIAAYNSFSPASAQGAALSKNVKLNGLTRLVATNSQAVVTIVGQNGTVITGGIVGDGLGLNTQWSLPDTVTIPGSGTIDVTATCTVAGATTAAAGSLTNILTPTLGWQSVTNAAIAAAGQPVETDAELRKRQTLSTALPAQTILEAMYAAIAAISGVSRLTIHENSADAADSDGVPGHTIAAIVLGGDVVQIATTIAEKKTPGTGTAGNVTELIVDENGVPSSIRFYELALVPMSVAVTIKALPGYTSVVGTQLQQNIADFLNALDIGEDSYLARLYTPANVGGTGQGATFYVTAITQARKPAANLAADVVIAFNEAAICAIADVALTVT